MNIPKISRNDPCPCGSGKKYKQCCQAVDNQKTASNTRLRESIPSLFKQALKYQQANAPDKAEAIYRQILEISPKHTETLHNLGLLACSTNRFDMAVELLRKAVRINPSGDYYRCLASALKAPEQANEALECLRKAISLNPADTIAYNNLGLWFFNQFCYEDAVAHFKKAISLNATDALAFINIGSCLLPQGRHNEAVQYFQNAIQINPHIHLAHHNLLFCLCFDSSAFPQTYLQVAQRFEKLLNKKATPYTTWQSNHTNKLRIGLVSGDFKNHPVGYFLENIISHFDRSKIELFAYSSQHNEDELTARIKPQFNQWTPIVALNDELAARKIHDDGIHILIDLAGHTQTNRLPVFAWKPAPVQVSWLGYFASTGMTFIDYFVADPVSVPKQAHSHFTEKVWYLPDTRLCFTPPNADIAPEPTPLPAINNGFVTFGCFQGLSKINDQMLALWATILHACPDSKLMIKNHQIKDYHAKQKLMTQLEHHQIPLECIILEEGSPRASYLTAYSRVDFMLDTFPFPGGTTTCEALWMGVPTLTLAGNTLLERQGASILNCVGLSHWIVYSEQEYLQQAIFHAHHLQQLKQLRANLRATMNASPLVDAHLFAKNLSTALLGMWHEKMAH